MKKNLSEVFGINLQFYSHPIDLLKISSSTFFSPNILSKIKQKSCENLNLNFETVNFIVSYRANKNACVKIKLLA